MLTRKGELVVCENDLLSMYLYPCSPSYASTNGKVRKVSIPLYLQPQLPPLCPHHPPHPDSTHAPPPGLNPPPNCPNCTNGILLFPPAPLLILPPPFPPASLSPTSTRHLSPTLPLPSSPSRLAHSSQSLCRSWSLRSISATSALSSEGVQSAAVAAEFCCDDGVWSGFWKCSGGGGGGVHGNGM